MLPRDEKGIVDASRIAPRGDEREKKGRTIGIDADAGPPIPVESARPSALRPARGQAR
jgi:hypothetical protein